MAESQDASEFVVVGDDGTEAKTEEESKEESKEETKTFEEKLAEEIEKAKGMKIGEMKLKLQSKGILTSTFVEKAEIVRAYAEVVVKEAENGGEQEDVILPEGEAAAARRQSSEDDASDMDPLEEMPLHVQNRVQKLMEFDEERETIMKTYLEDRAKLEAKYHALVKPLYEKRKAVVQGEMDDEIDKEHEGESEEGSGEKRKGVPQFWVCALGHMDVIAELIAEQDVDVLDLLEDVRCEDDENGEGFTLSFHFAPNGFFENNILTKRYEVPNLLLADEPILKNVYGCEILWKPDKCLTFKTTEKQQRGTGKNSGQVRNIKKKERCESLFHFFTPPKMPSMDDMDEEQVEKIESAFNEDYDLAQALRSHVIPKAVQWFTGQVRIIDLTSSVGHRVAHLTRRFFS
jgi:nucleosome assembly protein 1-like 1